MGTARDYSNTTRQSAPAAILAAALCLPAWGGVTIHVDSEAPAGGDGMSWRNPLIDLQAALDMSLQFNGQAVEIRLGAGTYVPTARTDETDLRSATFKLVDGVAILGGFAGFGAPDPDARDIQKHQTFLSGDLAGDDGPPGSFTNIADNAYHVVIAIDIVDETTALDGLTIIAGNACCIDDQFDPRGFGGGLYANNATLLMIQCTVEYNSGYSGGGAHFTQCDPMLVGCEFSNNRGVVLPTYSSPQGGAVYFTLSTPVLQGCTFTANTAKSGGATFHHFGSTVIMDCVFSDNAAQGIVPTAGAILAAAEELHITGSVFDGNTSHGNVGALRLLDCTTTIQQCTFLNNVSNQQAGALSASGATLVVVDSTFLSNHANSNVGALSSAVIDLQIHGCHFESNTCMFWGGATLIDGYFSGPTSAVITDCDFENNATSVFGSGAAVVLGNNNGMISHCTFVGNAAGQGGALHVLLNASHDFVVVDCSFSTNVADWGGAVFVEDGDPVIERCVFQGNVAEDGGAIVTAGMTGIINCLFLNNSASLDDDGRGGAIDLVIADSQIVNCTFVGNAAKGGGSVSSNISYSAVTFSNCIMWSNTAGAFLTADGSTTTVNRSNVEGGWNGPGGWNIDADPLFTDPAAGDYRLAQGSPCIDAADNDALPMESTIDLDGLPRFVDDQTAQNTGQGEGPLADMGAYERQIAPGFCPADCAQPVDNAVDVLDLLAVIATWGASRGPTDINGDGTVNVLDLLLVISAWGECP